MPYLRAGTFLVVFYYLHFPAVVSSLLGCAGTAWIHGGLTLSLAAHCPQLTLILKQTHVQAQLLPLSMSFSHPGAGKVSSSADMGGDPEKRWFCEQAVPEPAPPELPPSSAIPGFHFGEWGMLRAGHTRPSPLLGYPWGSGFHQTRMKKRERRMLCLIPACPHRFFGQGAEEA